MMSRTVRFNEVSLKATKKWVDSDGKKRQKTKKFSQTINPWNRDAYGKPKSRSQIIFELKQQIEDWIRSDS